MLKIKLKEDVFKHTKAQLYNQRKCLAFNHPITC
jgi:hypothetical protein